MTYAPVPSRRRALAEDSDRIGAPEPALFLDVTAPVPFACAEGFWVAGLIDELNYYLSPLTFIEPHGATHHMVSLNSVSVLVSKVWYRIPFDQSELSIWNSHRPNRRKSDRVVILE